MNREVGEPIAPLPGQLAFRFMDEPRAAERFRLASERARRSPGRTDEEGPVAEGGVRCR